MTQYFEGLTIPTVSQFDEEERLFSTKQSLSLIFDNKNDESKILAWDNEFEDYLAHRAKLIENEGQEKLLPFNLYKTLGLNWLDGYNYSQGSIGSCMGNAHKNAMKASNLVNQYFSKRKAPEICLSITYSFARANSGTTLRWGSGANLSEMSKWSAKLGNFSAESFGRYSDRGTNVRKPTEAEYKWALQHQSIIIPLKDNKFDTYYKLCAAGIGVAIGTRQYPGASKINSDGLGVVSSFSKGCLAPNQKVWTTEGNIEVEHLNGKTFQVLSYSKRMNRPAIKWATCQYIGFRPCVKIETSRGSFIVSEDHWMLQGSGKTIQAGDLIAYLSRKHIKGTCQDTTRTLLPSTVKFDNKGYLQVNTFRDEQGKKMKTRIHRLIGLDILHINPQAVIHHKNENILDNSLDNLEICTRSEHGKEHGFVESAYSEFALSQKGKSQQVKQTGISVSVREKWNKADFIKNRYSDRYREKTDDTGRCIIQTVTKIGILPVYNVEVIDDEEDDKRPYTEHNYAIEPLESKRRYGCSGIYTCNSHATAITGALTVNGKRYIWFENSHGNSRYKVGILGHGSGCWISEADFSPISRDWKYFGTHYGVVMELLK